MRKALALMILMAMSVAGCMQPQTKTQKGALAGAGIGAAAGAIAGQAIGRDTKGTLIGAAIGATVGGLAGASVGQYMDRQEQEMRTALAGVEGANIQRNQNLLEVTFKSDVLFDVDSSTIKPGGYSEIDRVGRVLNQYPQTNIRIAGHTDSTGTETYNQLLSERRAQSVKNALAAEGVSLARMSTLGFGESRPIADNSTPQGRQLNRRVEITITPITQ